ncbi:RluA family pseudouridine synthase [Phaeocystidibacter marisrubri]|uniref:Pseudouridine synthase n=1 Tax=Phaeocystidibacter marisrubri TaxID=1577780 RepID=A0A6L3ZIN2_9FLAO|nr:RluA family pseudouridine synthase [Phaeocystidibacter marisrubri]KAB2817040.1 RluA family pseudouridine synthase [Phaeocystidibacter marisrubri]GGH77099.1 pseudouridine synthase [Phaeocystidibacter marisrubri]
MVENYAAGEAENGDRTEEQFEHFKIVADPGQSIVRVDKFLQGHMENTSRNRIQSAAEEGSVHVNGVAVKSNYKVKPGDVVTLVLSYPPTEYEVGPEDIPLDILYRDEDVVVLNKEAGLVVHPGVGNYTGTLVNALMFLFDNLPTANGDRRPGLVHRLDKNTSGILVAAVTEESLTHLAKQFADRTTDREYIAIVWGNVEEDEGTITGNIGRSLKNRKVMSVFPEGDHGKHAVTHYKVLERLGYVTVVSCKLETGRTHQIRAHFKFIGHPLFNDEEYGGDKILKGTLFTKYKQFVQNCFDACPRQALHARRLAFDHPTTGERMEFVREIPEDMQTVIEKFRTYTQSRQE